MNKQELDKTIEDIMYPKNTPPKNLSKVSVIIAIIGIIAIFSIVYYGDQDGSGISGREDIKITHQENFYGISGRVLDVRNNSIVISTVALPFGDYNPKPNEEWVWTVFIDNGTEVLKFAADEQLAEGGHEDHMILSPSSQNILTVGDFVTVTSSDDIGTQFALAEKFMTASKIDVY